MGRITFAAADDQVLVAASEGASDDEFALLLAEEPSDDLGSLDVD